MVHCGCLITNDVAVQAEMVAVVNSIDGLQYPINLLRLRLVWVFAQAMKALTKVHR